MGSRRDPRKGIEAVALRTDGTEEPDDFFAAARGFAEQSTCPSGARHGVVITSIDGDVMAVGWGTPLRACDECWLRKKFAETGIKDFSVCPSIHAEDNAVDFLQRHELLSTVVRGTAWITREPCERCRELLISVGITDIRWPER